jgi:hypothetical protein
MLVVPEPFVQVALSPPRGEIAPRRNDRLQFLHSSAIHLRRGKGMPIAAERGPGTAGNDVQRTRNRTAVARRSSERERTASPIAYGTIPTPTQGLPSHPKAVDPTPHHPFLSPAISAAMAPIRTREHPTKSKLSTFAPGLSCSSSPGRQASGELPKLGFPTEAVPTQHHQHRRKEDLTQLRAAMA